MAQVGVALMLVGAVFLLIAAIGVLRLPDLLLRLQAAGKVGTFGGGLMLAGAALFFGEVGVAVRFFVILVLFIGLTPIVSHLLARAAYRARTPLWVETRQDELEARVQRQSADPRERERLLEDEIGN